MRRSRFVAVTLQNNRSKMALSGGADRGSHSMDKSITLPPDEIFRNLENAKRFAIDIGIITWKLVPLFFSQT